MIPVKTPLGQQVLKDRSVPLTPRQRAALIVMDGKRTVADVLQSSGADPDDVRRLLDLELITGVPPEGAVPPDAPVPVLSPKERYMAAYPIATKLTAGLGLRGMRLNLAVEGASNYEDLLAVADKIRDAVGPEKFAPLAAALQIPDR
jgi:hypothetical protein